MKITQIKRGKWYKTTQGIGICRSSGGTHPPSVQIIIRRPIPYGMRTLSPREVLEEIEAPAEFAHEGPNDDGSKD